MWLCLELSGSRKIIRKSGKGSAVERGSTAIPDGFVDRGIRKTR